MMLQGIRQYTWADWKLIAPIAVYAMVCILQLQDFLQWTSANFIIGSIGIPFMLGPGTYGKPSSRYGFVAVALCVIYLLLPVRTVLYCSVVAALLYTYETTRGKSSVIPLITLVLMSPIAQYFADAFSFPLRLKLTSVAGQLMQWMGKRVVVEGNVITEGNKAFSVDPACMGMHMLVSSLLCALLVIAVLQKRYNKRLGIIRVLLVLLATVALNAFANLMRILLLVQFSVMPGTVMHELTGILCLMVYVLVPLRLGLQWLIARVGRVHNKPEGYAARPRLAVHAGIGTLMLVGIILAPALNKEANIPLPAISGYRASYYNTEIVKLQNERVLVYLKDLKGFYSSEHHPMLCWTGEGYEFKKVCEKVLAGIPVMSGTLQKGHIVLYTAWWYSSGKATTASGLSWRWNAMRHGTPYSIVNVTAVSEYALQQEVAKLLGDEQLNGWISRAGRHNADE